MSIAGNHGLMFVRYDMAARAGHGAIQQFAGWAIDCQNTEYPGTHDTAMRFGYFFIFRSIHVYLALFAIQTCPIMRI
jgi:hypothetical protein